MPQEDILIYIQRLFGQSCALTMQRTTTVTYQSFMPLARCLQWANPLRRLGMPVGGLVCRLDTAGIESGSAWAGGVSTALSRGVGATRGRTRWSA